VDAAPRPRPRDRIIERARNLFRKHGFRGVGVDAIAEATSTNKMTLYRHFGSKDDLIVACIREIAAEVETVWDDLEAADPGDPMAQLHGWVRRAAEFATGDQRGCDIANAAVELTERDHPARKVIEQFKTIHGSRLANLCRAAGIEQADLLADTLCLLIEGARVAWQTVGPEGPGARFIEISEAVIASFGDSNAGAGRQIPIDGILEPQNAFGRSAGPREEKGATL
jgi:AcrR family transcriptional regulator